MGMSTAVKEYTSVDSGGGGSAWGMGAGLLFLVLFILIIFGFAWSRDSHRDGRDHIREHFERAGNDSAYQRGDIREILTNAIRSNERINDIYQNSREIIGQNQALALLADRGLDRVNCAVERRCDALGYQVREAAQSVIKTGETFGFRTHDVVFPDPCRDRCRDDRGGGGGGYRVFDLNTGTQTGNAIGGGLNTLAAGAVQGPIAG
jgi:hypothetical protein